MTVLNETITTTPEPVSLETYGLIEQLVEDLLLALRRRVSGGDSEAAAAAEVASWQH